MDLIKAPKGTKDVVPSESYKWQYIENILKDTADKWAISQIRFPVFEHTELFLRGVGETTDVVSKEMYTFMDKGGRSITLRPEGTASAVRMFLENSLYAGPLPLKVYYIAPNFRYEKPQAGRLRQHHQFGAEYFGANSPLADSELICMADTFLKKLGITNITAHINSIGCPECRPNYQKKLYKFLDSKKENLCSTCNDRLAKNPMRILDCKSPHCNALTKEAPVSIDYLCHSCIDHMESVKASLENLNINFEIDTGIVRGLDYYCKTVFEFVSNDIGAKGTILGGGRYDALVEMLGGAPTSAIGFGCGIERLIMLMENLNLPFGEKKHIDIFVANTGDDTKGFTENFVLQLRLAGISVASDLSFKSIKNQLKYADKIGTKYNIVIGADEISSNKITLKNMYTGEKIIVDLCAREIAKIIMEA